MLNDFESCAYAVPALCPKTLVQLYGQSSICFKNFSKYLLVGPGTGYGISMITKRFSEVLVYCSEGGHMCVPCLDRDHFDFEQLVKRRMNVPPGVMLSAEWTCCGRGIPLLYEFYCQKAGKSLERPLKGEDIFATIETDPIAKQTFDRFLQILGALLMANCAVLLPDSGIVLSGNILKSVLPLIQKDMQDPTTSHFFKGFYGNEALNNYLKSIPIYFTSESDLNLKGCLVGVV